MDPDFARAVTQVLRATVPGDLITYGELAHEAGYPGRARAVPSVLRAVDDLPWWRVVPASGRLAAPVAVRQAQLLRAEGIVITDAGRIQPPSTDEGIDHVPQHSTAPGRRAARHRQRDP